MFVNPMGFLGGALIAKSGSQIGLTIAGKFSDVSGGWIIFVLGK